MFHPHTIYSVILKANISIAFSNLHTYVTVRLHPVNDRHCTNMTHIKPKAELWLSEGKKRFARKGTSGINIEEMSKSIGISKSSFYFLFSNKERFLEELFRYWEYEGTYRIMSIVDLVKDLLAKLQTLTEFVYTNMENDQFMLQLLNYAESNKKAAASLKAIDDNRKKFLTALFIELKFNKKEATRKMRLYSTFYMGIIEQFKFNQG